MAKIFVSYSRKDIDFTRRLTEGLKERGLDFWVDWEGIPPSTDWMLEIQRGIESADCFLFVISPNSIASRVCKEELELAVKNGKRLIPVVALEVAWQEAPAELAHLNYIFFRQNDDFSAALDKLLAALNTDFEWVQTQRRLQVKALEWQRGSKDNGFLLHGTDLDQAEQQISVNATKDPTPTDLQREYVLNSRQAATRRRRQDTGLMLALLAVMLGVIILLLRPYVQERLNRLQAQTQSKLLTVPAAIVPVHFASGDKDIAVAEYSIEMQAVSNRLYKLCVDVNKCTAPIGADFAAPEKKDQPVVWVTIVEAATYCSWVERRLPSTAEWQQAASMFATFGPVEQRFAISGIFEWTSTHQDAQSPTGVSDWDGQTRSLMPDWDFQQRKITLTSTDHMTGDANTTHALVGAQTLGFRCAKK